MCLHHRSAVRAASLIVVLVILAGCSALPTVGVPATQTSALPAVVAATAASTSLPAQEPSPVANITVPPTVPVTPTSSPAPQPTPELAPTIPAASSASTTSAPPVAPLFGPAWGDRSVYRAGLVTSEQPVLDKLQGTSEYRIDLKIDDSLTKVSGVEQVHYTNRENKPLNEIYVRLFPNALGGRMRVSDVTVDGAGVTPEYQFEDTAVRIPLPEPLPVGASTVVGLNYGIDVPTTLDKGYGLISYTNDILALDTPYAPIPVYNDEGWNVEIPPENADTSFNDVSFYLVRVNAPADLKLVATGVETARQSEGARQTVTFEQGPGRDFFLAASPDYVLTSAQAGETKVNSYALPGEEAAAKVTLDAAVRGLADFGKRFGPYPYTEFDVAATPMLALGIEYPGTVGVSERIYEQDYKSNSGPAAVIQESTLAHELAHQWFYNLVGNDQIDQPWLDEATAQYATWLYYLDVDGQAAADAWASTWGSRWDRTDRTQKPVGLPAADYTDREYSSVVYGRGPMFLAALAERMGQDKFDQFLKDYSARFRWGIATTADFKAMASQACGCDLNDLYKEWLDPAN
jgi:aminopeptidase N